MHPTPNEQLQAIGHLIDRVQANPELSPGSVQLLGDALRLLRRLERSWSRRMPFLIDDNRRAMWLLDELRPLLTSLSAEIPAAAELPAAESEEAARRINVELQGLLARAVHVLGDGPDGDRGRARIAEHLRHRIAADPALNRDPVERPVVGP